MTRLCHASHRTSERAPSACALRVASIVVTLLLASPAWAWGPLDAVARDGGPRVHAAEARLARAEADLAWVLGGLGAELAATPELAYGGDVEDAPELTPSLSVDVEVRWTHDVVAALAARIDVVRAREALADARRAEGKEALETLGDVLRAQLAAAAAETDARDARAEAETAGMEGDPLAIALAALDVRAAQVDLADARADVLALEAHARELGFAGAPTFAPVRFVLPPADARSTFAYEILALEEARAHARAQRQRTYGILRDVELAARWESRTDRVQLDAAVALPGGRPSAMLGAAYGPQQDDQWSIGISARIAVDERTPHDLAAAEDAVVRAGAGLDTWRRAFDRDVAEALRHVEAADARLRIAADRWAIRARALEDLRDRSVDLARAERLARRDRDRMYLAWLRYVEEVDDYLALVDGAWAIEPGGASETRDAP